MALPTLPPPTLAMPRLMAVASPKRRYACGCGHGGQYAAGQPSRQASQVLQRFTERLQWQRSPERLSKQVRHHQRHPVGTVGRHSARLHHRRLDRFKLGYHRCTERPSARPGPPPRRSRRIGAAAAIADDDAPCQPPRPRSDVTEPKEAAAEANSMANPSQVVVPPPSASWPCPGEYQR